MGVSRLPLMRTPSGEDLVSVIAGYESKKLFSLSMYEVIFKSPRSIEFLQFFTSFTKIWTIGPKIESKMGKKRQFTMERPELHCMTLLFRFAFQVESFCANFSLFLFILSVRRSVSSAYVPRNATQLAMCLGSCARNLKTFGQRRTSSVYKIQDGGRNTLRAVLTKYARSKALTRHCRFTVMFYGF